MARFLALATRPPHENLLVVRPLLSPIPPEIEDHILELVFYTLKDARAGCVECFFRQAQVEARRFRLRNDLWRDWLRQRLEYLSTRVLSRDLDGHFAWGPGRSTHAQEMWTACKRMQDELETIMVDVDVLKERPLLKEDHIDALEYTVQACERTLRLFRALSLDPGSAQFEQSRWASEMLSNLRSFAIAMTNLVDFIGRDFPS